MALAFEIDDESFEMFAVEFQREFSKPLAETAATTLDGRLRYETEGPYCYYTLQVRPAPGEEADLERLWDKLSRPKVFSCVFYCGDHRIVEDMYVTECKQKLQHIEDGKPYWGGLTVRFLPVGGSR